MYRGSPLQIVAWSERNHTNIWKGLTQNIFLWLNRFGSFIALVGKQMLDTRGLMMYSNGSTKQTNFLVQSDPLLKRTLERLAGATPTAGARGSFRSLRLRRSLQWQTMHGTHRLWWSLHLCRPRILVFLLKVDRSVHSAACALWLVPEVFSTGMKCRNFCSDDCVPLNIRSCSTRTDRATSSKRFYSICQTLLGRISTGLVNRMHLL